MIYWDRKTIKQRAKDVITGHYWQYFLAVVVCEILGGALTHFTVRINVDRNQFRFIDLIRYVLLWARNHYPYVIATLAVAGIGRILWRMFISNPLEVGNCRYRTLASYRRYEFQNVFFPFAEGRYLSTVIALCLRDIYVTLWTVLFIVPGIIKLYSYFMVPYILAENPGISRERAFEISKKTTRGEKWRMLLLDLSFIGWYLLGALCFGFGVLFVVPYHSAAKAELYGAMRFKAAREAICRPEEIGSELFTG